jgi:hypothetical protein
MRGHESTPLLISELCALARDQLKTQAARSTALEASSLGIIAFDGTFATIALTFGRPPIARVRRRHETAGDGSGTEHLLDWLEQDIHVNERALKRKQPLSKLALIFLALAVAVELIGALS